jgi:asparagine synthase (glutamine-hydrolysing)
MFGFASEAKAIFRAGLHEPSVNIQALDSYLSLNYSLGPETAFQGIWKLLPGHCLTFEAGEVSVKRYWDYSDLKEIRLGESEYLERLNQLLRETIKSHLMSEVPLGVFLSGGVDSTTALAISIRQGFQPVALSFDYGQRHKIELERFKRLARLPNQEGGLTSAVYCICKGYSHKRT